MTTIISKLQEIPEIHKLLLKIKDKLKKSHKSLLNQKYIDQYRKNINRNMHNKHKYKSMQSHRHKQNNSFEQRTAKTAYKLTYYFQKKLSCDKWTQ